MPITKEQAMNLHHGATLHYTGKHQCKRTVGPRGGVTESITAVRVSGKCQTWKTRPTEFRLPIKYGLYENSAVNHYDAGDWHLPEDCPLVKTETETAFVKDPTCVLCDYGEEHEH